MSMKIYTVETGEYMTEIWKYFLTKKEAEAFMKERIKEYKENESWAKNEDYKESGGKNRNGQIIKGKEYKLFSGGKLDIDKKVLLIADIYMWEKCSYEYDEWDISKNQISLVEINIE